MLLLSRIRVPLHLPTHVQIPCGGGSEPEVPAPEAAALSRAAAA